MCCVGNAITEVYEVLKSHQSDVVGIYTARKNSKVLFHLVILKNSFVWIIFKSFKWKNQEDVLLAVLRKTIAKRQRPNLSM